MAASRTGAGVLPLPLVEPPAPPRSRSRRVWQRYRRVAARIALVNCCVVALNVLYVSFSSTASLSVPSAKPSVTLSPLLSTVIACWLRPSRPHNRSHHMCAQYSPVSNASHLSFVVTSAQARALAHVYRCVSRFCRRRGAVSAPVCGDGLDPSVEVHRLFECGERVFPYAPHLPAVVPIVASRVSLPSSAASVPLLDLLPPALAVSYADAGGLVRAPDPDGAPGRPRRARARVFGAQAEYVSLVRRMSALGMLDFTDRPRVVNGVFGVPKGDGMIRLIIDARPANACFVDPPHVDLPTPDLVARLFVAAHCPVFVAKVDLDNFYHRLRLPEWIRPWFALPAVRASDVGLAHRFGADAWINPCCATLPMGWSHSVYLAQRAHLHFVSTATPLRASDRITATNDLAVDRTRHQVYIDDLILVGRDERELLCAQDQYMTAAEARGLAVKMAKVVRPTTRAECLGLEVDGVAHTVGLSATKLDALCRDTLAVVLRGVCSGHELSQVVGRWTWACLARRPALSVFSAVYRFIECARYRVFEMWPSVRRELVVVVGLAPLLFSSLSASWFPDVVATDASHDGLGVVAASAPAADAVDAAGAADVMAALGDLRWRTIVSSAWDQLEHINVLELRAVSTGLRWALSRPAAVGCRLLLLCDSQVVVGAMCKGRSSSQELLRVLRGVCALALASGVQVYVRWVQSVDNPADEPSRFVRHVRFSA